MKDLNKTITDIVYNWLNLPNTIVENGNTHSFIYDDDGRKLYDNLSTKGILSDEMHYCQNVIYKNWEIDRIMLDGGYGYVTFTGDNATGTPVYHWYQKDHLGSNRLVVNQDGTIEQVSHYYPYGMSFAEGTDNSGNQYKYDGKELDATGGLNLYDYGARYMDPALGRFTTMDPMAEKYYDISPYAYAGDNPVNNIDMNGDTISVNINNTMYYYQQNAQGEYGVVDASGNAYSGDDSFMGSVSSALGNLTSGKEGKSIVDYLISPKGNVKMKPGDENGTTIDGKTINWDPNSRLGGINQYGSTDVDPFINLGHEMAHAQDIWNGTVDMSTWVTGIGIDGQTKVTTNAEKYAMGVENLIRAEHYLPLRDSYRTIWNSSTNRPMVDPATPPTPMEMLYWHQPAPIWSPWSK